MKPEVLKKIFDCLWVLKPIEEKLTRAKTGKVPKAKKNMVNAPAIKLPVDRVYICIAWVKPHGKKKVAIPIKIGVTVDFNRFKPAILLANDLGWVQEQHLFREKTFNNFKPKTNITIEIRMFKTKLISVVKVKAEPIKPTIPPKRKKEIKRPR